jgi:hypothetical protein
VRRGELLVPVGQEGAAGNRRHVRDASERKTRVLRVKRQRSESLRSQDRCRGSLGGGRRWRADRASLRDAAGAGDGSVAGVGCWPVG